MLLATIRQLLGGEVRPLDVAVIDPTGAHLPGFDASRPAGSTTTAVPVSNASAVLAAANANRRKLIINNISGKTVYVVFGATATKAGATFPLPNNQVYDGDLNGYTGVVSGILDSGSGNVNVTEVTTT